MKNLIMCSLFLLLLSCGQGTLYKEYKKYDDLVWSKADPVSFTFVSESDTATRGVFLAFRYAQGFSLQKMMVEVTEKTPDGTSTNIPLSFDVRDAKGGYLGEGSGDIWDLEVPIKQHQKLLKGSYTYTFSQSTFLDKLPMVMEVGLVVR